MRRSPATRWAPCRSAPLAATAPAPASSTAGPPGAAGSPGCSSSGSCMVGISGCLKRGSCSMAPPPPPPLWLGTGRPGGSHGGGVFVTRVGSFGGSPSSSGLRLLGGAPCQGAIPALAGRYPTDCRGRFLGSNAFWSLPPSIPSARRMVSPSESLDWRSSDFPSPGPGSASATAPPAPADEQPRCHEACRRGDTHTRSHPVTTSRPTPAHGLTGVTIVPQYVAHGLLVIGTIRAMGHAIGGRLPGDSVVLRHRTHGWPKWVTR